MQIGAKVASALVSCIFPRMQQNTTLLRDTPATVIPAGDKVTLPAGLNVFITQSLGGNVTVRTEQGLLQIAREHASALRDFQPGAELKHEVSEFSEGAVWEALKTCFDPEIPVNIVDLGLIYDLAIEKTASDGHHIQVKMTLTAPGCGMGPVIAEDARQKIAALPTVEKAEVHIVWDPQWAPQMISPVGRKTLGLE
jgi:probable FeS assembly SUF system protein SufT